MLSSTFVVILKHLAALRGVFNYLVVGLKVPRSVFKRFVDLKVPCSSLLLFSSIL